MPGKILRVGLTGNIAAGKSTVASWLDDLGCHVLDLDALGHECLRPGTSGHDAVVQAFGEAILGADGSIDRRALGAVVFADRDARRRLEAILHPAIRELEQRRIDEIAAAHDAAIVVSEAALLYETGAFERYDRMVVVTAPDEVRRGRLRDRGLSPDEATGRMASQMPQQRKAELADYVVDNGGGLEETRAITRQLAELLHRDLERRVAGAPLGRAARLELD